MSELTVSGRSGDLVAWWCHDPTRDRAPGWRYESLGHYDQLINRIIALRQEGRTIKQIAAQLNGEGYHTPRSRKGYTSTSGAGKLLSRCELTHGRIGTR